MSKRTRRDSENNPGKYVARSEYQQTTRQFSGEIKLVKLALFGEDGRGGMVKDVQEIRSSLKAATSIIKSVGVPIFVAVASALITAYFLSTVSL